MKGLLMRLLIGKPEIMFSDVWCLDLETKAWTEMTSQINIDSYKEGDCEKYATLGDSDLVPFFEQSLYIAHQR